MNVGIIQINYVDIVPEIVTPQKMKELIKKDGKVVYVEIDNIMQCFIDVSYDSEFEVFYGWLDFSDFNLGYDININEEQEIDILNDGSIVSWDLKKFYKVGTRSEIIEEILEGEHVR